MLLGTARTLYMSLIYWY